MKRTCKHCKEKISYKELFCPNCKKDLRNWGQKHPVIVLILFWLFLVWLFLVWIFTPEEQEKHEKKLESKNIEKVLTWSLNQGIQENLDDVTELKIFIWMVDSLIENPDYITWEVTDYITWEVTVEGIFMLVGKFWAFAFTVEKYENHTSDDIKELSKELKIKTSFLQSRDFPRIRKIYADLFKNHFKKQMPEYDIDANVKWKYNEILEFTWVLFWGNENQLDFLSPLQDGPSILRFDDIRFRVTKYDEEYSYKKIYSLLDSEVESFKD